ncbi:MAG: type I DNA topoisomerase [Anaeromyxobacter sp.]|nr:type I DNA topoisomerase [Anaeromyxobacter sp.]MBL0275030.1 type I DNA topoisomerase [Anaeromyxobacter sp.]
MSAPALVIVESPAKAKTIEKYLGPGYRVMASIGHVVDLPSKGLCVDVENGFALTYEVTKGDVVKALREALKGASTLYLATDEDREGEAIAWHLMDRLKPRIPVKRMVFNEITKKAITEAVTQTRELDTGLVDAQEARRVLDRLYGYEVSPVLWRKVQTGLSAGRVQSPATRLVVQRELERMRFRSAGYWDLTATHPTQPRFESTLTAVDGRKVATGKDFDEQGKLTSEARLLDEAAARALAASLAGRPFTVRSLERRPYHSSPKPPFITSTLQQEGGRKLRLSAQQVMRLAQGLYERGYITYMRTDSTTLSATAVAAARAQIGELFGDTFLPEKPRSYLKKAKNAQEAHEAVRPAGDAFRTPESLQGELNGAELRLYELIWKRTIASQMADAVGESVSLKLEVAGARGERCEFAASGRTIVFPGFLRAYVEGTDDPEAALDDQETPLPALAQGAQVAVEAVSADGHATSPPARYTEASLVKKLEELGIGRPSTYASIMGSLAARYVWKKGQALVPDWVAFIVIALMEQHFGVLVDYAFTAEMEDDLDQIAGRDRAKLDFLKAFYFGDGQHPGLKKLVTEGLEKIDPAALNRLPIGLDPQGVEVVARVGRYGPYLKRGEDTAPIPDKLAPDELTVEKALEILATPRGGKRLGDDPATGLPIFAKSGRFGPYVQLGEAKDGEKPQKTQSLLKTMKPETVTLEEALQLLSLPRGLGRSPEGEEVLACYGKFGPYLTMGKESRNLGGSDDGVALSITLEQALEIFKQPKQFRGRGQPKPPLATFGEDPVSGGTMVLKEGKFGFYITDGETNASLRKGDDPADVTPERASELLAERREYMASPEGQKKAALRAAKKGQRPARGKAGKPAKARPAAAEGKPPAKAARTPAAPAEGPPKAPRKRAPRKKDAAAS